MRTLLFFLLTAGCWTPTGTGAIERCDAGDYIDCCNTSEECLAHFGGGFPYCVHPGRETGQCVECTVPEHCGRTERCVEDDVRGNYCAPEQ